MTAEASADPAAGSCQLTVTAGGGHGTAGAASAATLAAAVGRAHAAKTILNINSNLKFIRGSHLPGKDRMLNNGNYTVRRFQ